MEGNSNSTPSSISRTGLGYGIGIAVGIVILVSVVKLVYYAFIRVQRRTQFGRAAGNATVTAQEQNRSAMAVPGLDQATLDLYPKFEYSEEEKRKSGGEHQSGCSICLGDYKDSDLLRMLPDCGHTFHVTCIDAWMKLHATCPMCRTSPLPSPLSTPMSELVPLSRHTMPIHR